MKAKSSGEELGLGGVGWGLGLGGRRQARPAEEKEPGMCLNEALGEQEERKHVGTLVPLKAHLKVDLQPL